MDILKKLKNKITLTGYDFDIWRKQEISSGLKKKEGILANENPYLSLSVFTYKDYLSVKECSQTFQSSAPYILVMYEQDMDIVIPVTKDDMFYMLNDKRALSNIPEDSQDIMLAQKIKGQSEHLKFEFTGYQADKIFQNEYGTTIYASGGSIRGISTRVPKKDYTVSIDVSIKGINEEAVINEIARRLPYTAEILSYEIIDQSIDRPVIRTDTLRTSHTRTGKNRR